MVQRSNTIPSLEYQCRVSCRDEVNGTKRSEAKRLGLRGSEKEKEKRQKTKFENFCTKPYRKNGVTCESHEQSVSDPLLGVGWFLSLVGLVWFWSLSLSAFGQRKRRSPRKSSIQFNSIELNPITRDGDSIAYTQQVRYSLQSGVI